MSTIAGLHPVIQTTVLHFAHPEWSFARLGDCFGISKQAVQKRLAAGKPLLGGLLVSEPPSDHRLVAAEREISRLNTLIKDLQRRLVLYAAMAFMLSCFKERIQEFFPRFKLKRLRPHEKKRILDLWGKFERLGGSMKDLAAAIERSPDTIREWLLAYARYGIAGLADRTTRPKHFGHKLPLWVRDQLLMLFLRHPEWTPYQYHKYMKMSPATQFYVSLPTIEKLKAHHTKKTAEERDRQKKLWAFAPGSAVWTVDFTCILKTERFKLQLLTVSDHRSRFLLDTALFLDTSTERVLDHLEDLFVKYGKPFMIKADNGPEFRMECRKELEDLGVYLFSSPIWYGQFNGAHERIHREMKGYITDFDVHRNLERLVTDISRFRDDHNHRWPLEILDHKTPAQVFYSEEEFIPKDVEIVRPYVKDGELRMKFTDRVGNQARMAMPLIRDKNGSAT